MNDNINAYKALATNKNSQWVGWGGGERERAYSAFSMDIKQQVKWNYPKNNI